MAEYKLKLEKRELSGKKTKDVRAAGMVPSVVYGGKTPAMTASEYIATEKVLNAAGYHSPIDLELDGKKKLAIVKNVQIDPVSRRILNVEFQAVSAKEMVTATTPVVILNFETSEAAKIYHFAMTQSLEEIEVKAKPADLPKELEIDAGGMKTVDDKLTIADIKMPEGVELADKELSHEQVVASLYDPAEEAEKRENEEVVTDVPQESEAASEEAKE